MGTLRSSDWRRSRAKHLRYLGLDRPRQPVELLEDFYDQAAQMRLEVVPKSTFPGVRWQSLSTTFYSQIRTGTDFDDKSPFWRAVTMGHELYHARQWRVYGRSTFRTKYLTSGKFRMAMEAQAYAESVRIIVALGGSQAVVERYIDHVVQGVVGTYALGWAARPSKVRRLFDVVLHEAAVDARANIRRPPMLEGVALVGAQ